VAEDDKGVVCADDVGYFLECIVFTHTDGTFGLGKGDLDRNSGRCKSYKS